MSMQKIRWTCNRCNRFPLLACYSTNGSITKLMCLDMKQFPVWKCQAQRKEVATIENSSNYAPVLNGPNVASSKEKENHNGNVSSGTIADASSIFAFMAQVSDLVKALRPYPISSKRIVSAHIDKPWANDGIPKVKPNSDLQHTVEVKSPDQIEIIRETCRNELEAAKSEIQKWHSSFQNEPFIPAGTTPAPKLVINYLQALKSSEESLREQLEKAKKKEVAFIITFAKREQEIVELKNISIW